MSEASYASLGPTLLARKGGARPAMRPQLAPLPETLEDEALEDLGWNDMGGDEQPASAADTNVVSLTPGASAIADQARSPIVKRQQRDLAQRVLADAAMEGPEAEPEDEAEFEETGDSQPDIAPPALIRTKPHRPVASPANHPRRAAFTLRLDTDRHLKLRLAATMQGISAQALVTEALDAMLSQIDDLDALAERMKRH
jgi:hypothetical protein